MSDASNVEYRRLHPLTMVYGAIARAPGLALGFYAASTNKSEAVSFLIFSMMGLFFVPAIFLRYLMFRFHISSSALSINTGVIQKNSRSIPVDRIQNIAIEQNFLQRLLGIAKVVVETAGAKEPEGILEFVSLRDAEDIRNTLRKLHSEAIGQAAVQSDSDGQAEQEVVPPPLFAMSNGEAFRAGLFRFSPVLFAVVFSAFNYLNFTRNQFLEQKLQQLEQGLLNTAPYWLVLIGLLVLAVAALLSWLLGAAIRFNTLYGYKLTLEAGRIHREHGLFGKWKGAIPLNKVQMFTLRTNPLSRAFGLMSLDLQTAGSGQTTSAEMAVPLAPESETITLAKRIRYFEMPEHFLPVSPKSLPRAIVRYVVLAALLVTALGIAQVNPFIVGPIILPLAVLFAYKHYQYRGYALVGSTVLVRKGWIGRSVRVIPAEKLQTISVRATFMQRRLGLASVVLDTAATGALVDAIIDDIDSNDAKQIAEELRQLLTTQHSHR